jgi:hypothetical protein
MRLNGTSLRLTAAGTTESKTVSGTIAAFAGSTFVGRNYDNADHLHADVFAVVTFDRELADGEVDDWREYFEDKYKPLGGL